MDLAISKWVVETFGNSKLFALVSKFLTYIGETGAIVMLVVILLAFKKTRRLGIYMGCIVGFSYIVNAAIFKPLIARDRPFIEYENLGQMCKLADYPFPDGYSMASGHSTASMSIAMTVFLFNRKYGWTAFAYPLVVGFTRIALCVHYFTDVLAGFAWGAIAAVGVYFLLKFIEKKIFEKRKIKNENNRSS